MMPFSSKRELLRNRGEKKEEITHKRNSKGLMTKLYAVSLYSDHIISRDH